MTNLTRIFVAESYAGRGAFITPYQIYGWTPEAGPTSFNSDMRDLQPYYAFARDYAELLDGYTTAFLPNAACLMDARSRRWRIG